MITTNGAASSTRQTSAPRLTNPCISPAPLAQLTPRRGEKGRGLRLRPVRLGGFLGGAAVEFAHVVEVGFEGAEALGQAAEFGDQVLALALRQVGLDPLPAAPV